MYLNSTPEHILNGKHYAKQEFENPDIGRNALNSFSQYNFRDYSNSNLKN